MSWLAIVEYAVVGIVVLACGWFAVRRYVRTAKGQATTCHECPCATTCAEHDKKDSCERQ